MDFVYVVFQELLQWMSVEAYEEQKLVVCSILGFLLRIFGQEEAVVILLMLPRGHYVNRILD